MKKVLISGILIVVAFLKVFANNNETGEYYERGTYVQYHKKDGIQVHASGKWKKTQFGKFYFVSLRIINQSGHVFNVMPEQGYFKLVKKNEIIDYGAGYGYEEYMSLIKKKSNSKEFWMAFATGLSNANAGYSSSYASSQSTSGEYTSTYVTTYNNYEANQQISQSYKELNNYSAMLDDAFDNEIQSYLKPETMDNYEELYGLIGFKYKKADLMKFTINVDGQPFEFSWIID